MKRSSNPALRSAILEKAQADIAAGGSVATMNGAISKTAILLGVLLASAGYIWWWIQGQQEVANLNVLMVAGVLGTLVLALVTIFVPRIAPYTAPIYAASEGVLLGALSGLIEQKFSGVPMMATLLTFGVLAAMLVLYRTGVVKVTRRFVTVILGMMLGIAACYLISLLLALFGIYVPMVYGNGPTAIVFSVFVVGVASFSLMIDFEAIVDFARNEQPKYFEWYAAFSLLIGLVWLYIEILDLLIKIKSRD